jgi:hypothetical protein
MLALIFAELNSFLAVQEGVRKMLSRMNELKIQSLHFEDQGVISPYH